MFDMSGTLDIGARNDQAVRAALAQAQVVLRATATGGNQGRTVRVEVGAGIVSVRGAGQRAVTLLDPSSAAAAGATWGAGSRAAVGHRTRSARTACAAASATGAQP